ncbi:pyrroline-5-carboxylate reductase [Roseospira marina]|uniref:Pyrroline-5-carboxylate reductase n=1 Tax=Roseospira marina TaxID=140057 RepID=A0A5M6IGL4_9PROT|nr:pyrroline-5-carboxylate reductase [Roseospira marina]KAA5607413.1 pyrroline-5-carboxylate reductase [Roseospira marina]MBB4312414.1 pyrroline-5-carboxylate reductase [Roseospira marina]MBB5085570.1 pyrroline-5-carboxylate reductase [Roseospira marina]
MPAADLTRAALSAARVWLVGGGKMGGALLTGWLDHGVAPDNVTVIDPGLDQGPHGVRLAADPAAPLAEGPAPDVLLLAVKPQVMDSVLPAYRALGGGPTVVLSVAAGRLIAGFETAFGPGTPVVRSIPNTPAAVHRGMTVACANGHVTDTARATCEALLGAVGDIAWVTDEALIDAVTAVSGSGPAYVFWLTECMTQAGIDGGLPADLAARIARATVCGAGALMDASPEDPATLRRNVTSPNGTTAAALEVLMQESGGLGPLMSRAVAAATQRSQDLAG